LNLGTRYLGRSAGCYTAPWALIIPAPAGRGAGANFLNNRNVNDEGRGQMPVDYDSILVAANSAVDRAADWLNQADGLAFSKQTKPSGEEVTQADIAVQNVITRYLESENPEVRVVGEESSSHNFMLPAYWLVDPIDGTINLVRGAPYYAVSLAYVEDGAPVVGVIYAPLLNFRMSATTADRPADIVHPRAVDEAIVGITGTGGAEPDAANVVARMHRAAYRIRMHGSMAMDLASVATGWIDACVCLKPHPWDVAAGLVLAKANGYTVIGSDGADYSWGSRYLIAGPASIVHELADLVNETWV
jgi:myo-inositol-1(or 4)-monophosphatase